MFISPAYAQATAEAANSAPSTWMSLLPLVVIFVLFYFLIIRPQSKRIREHNELVAALKPGDKVVTGGGLYATVVALGDTDITVEIAPGVQVKAQKFTVTALTKKK
jgi:preprotein translocase subunit YajC